MQGLDRWDLNKKPLKSTTEGQSQVWYRKMWDVEAGEFSNAMEKFLVRPVTELKVHAGVKIDTERCGKLQKQFFISNYTSERDTVHPPIW